MNEMQHNLVFISTIYRIFCPSQYLCAVTCAIICRPSRPIATYLTGPTCACIVKPLSSVERCDLAARAKETLRSPYQRNHAHKKNTRILDRCAAGVMANEQRAHASCAARYYGWLDHNIK